jgi:hypothetical protein
MNNHLTHDTVDEQVELPIGIFSGLLFRPQDMSCPSCGQSTLFDVEASVKDEKGVHEAHGFRCGTCEGEWYQVDQALEVMNHKAWKENEMPTWMRLEKRIDAETQAFQGITRVAIH